MFGDQGHHHNSHCTGCTRYHSRASADYRGYQPHHKGTVEADNGLYARDKGKSYGFRNQGKRNSKTGKRIITNALFAWACELKHVKPYLLDDVDEKTQGQKFQVDKPGSFESWQFTKKSILSNINKVINCQSKNESSS